MSAPATPTRFCACSISSLETVLLLLQPDDPLVGLVAELAFGEARAVRCRVVDGGGEPGRFVPPDAVAGEGSLHPHAKDFARRAELPADDLGLPDEGVQHAVLFALVVDEIAAGHDPGGLELAIDAAVALFEPRRVPGQIEVDEVVAAGLKVQPLARGVGADEDPHGRLIEGRVEGDLDSVALLEARLAGEDKYSPIEVDAAAASLEKPLLQPIDEPSTCVVPLGEEDEPPIPPGVRGVEHVGLSPVENLLDARVGSDLARRR